MGTALVHLVGSLGRLDGGVLQRDEQKINFVANEAHSDEGAQGLRGGGGLLHMLLRHVPRPLFLDQVHSETSPSAELDSARKRRCQRIGPFQMSA